MSNLIHFNGQDIRQTDFNGEPHFSIIDIVAVLSNSRNPNRYWSDLKSRLKEEGFQPYANIVRLKMIASDGKNRATDCANRATIFRIIQSIPSPKAEPFKNWLAQTGEERLQETEDPTQAMERVRQSFRDLGYSEQWIETRIKTKKGRIELTNEWKRRGIQNQGDYATLTALLSAGTFGLIPSDHKRVKGLQNENLRDHMTEEELIFTQLAELETRKGAITDDAQGLEENKEVAKKGGIAAGAARKAFEEQTGRKVVSSSNFLSQIKAAKAKLLDKKDSKK